MPSHLNPPAPTPTPYNTESLEGFEGWCFGACELRPLRRELKVNGSVRALPGKSLDLLLLLIRERHRVVSHNELVQRLWAQGDASGRMLPATIARLRAVIDCDSREWGHETSAIRTVHRTGYRFVAPLRAIEPDAPRSLVPLSPAGQIKQANWVEDADAIPFSAGVPYPTPASASAHVSTTASLAPALRLGLLRCLNLTEKPSLAGTEVGLVALTGHALARDPRLSVADADLPVKWSASDTNTVDSSVERLMQNLSLQALVRCTLQAAGDMLVLEHTLVVQGLPPVHGSSRAVCPHVLSLQLAQWVQTQLFGEQAEAMHLESDEDFVNLAFAKAMALFDHADYLAAVELLNMVSSMQPDSLAAELWRVRAWTRAADPRATAAGLDFLAKARARGDAHTLTQALTALREPVYI